jgi:hypothetical protein
VGESTGYGNWHNAAEDYEPKVDISYTGQARMKFGFSYNRYTKNQQLQNDAAGDFGFGQNQTGNGNGRHLRRSVHEHGDRSLGRLSRNRSRMAIRHYVNQTTVGLRQRQLEGQSPAQSATRLRYDALPHAWERNNQT